MFGAACKGLHCACCKTYGVGPVLALVILYITSRLTESAVVRLILDALEIVALAGVAVAIITGISYAILTRMTRGRIRVDTGRPSWERINAAASNHPQIPRMAPVSALVNHRRVPVLYRETNERKADGQFVVPSWSDER